MIRVGLSIGEMNSNTPIHAIDAKTSYNLLLGRPWIHENRVVSSTLHRCLKYRRDGEIVKIDADIKPFTETESYFADAKFYLDSCEPKVEKPSSDDEADVKSEEENVAQWTTTKLPTKGIEEVSIKISSSEGDIQTKIEEHLDFCYITRTTRKSPSRKILSKYKEQVHEERDHFEVVADKEICSAFPSRMKRKSILSISADGPLKVQRRTIVYTCQPHKEAKKEKESMPTIQGSQREKSNFVETSYHITVEDSPCLNVDDEVHKAPPQLEDGRQSTVDELKELNLGTPKDPRPTFISALLTPQEEEEYSKLLTEYKDVFAWSYKEMPGLSPKVVVHHLGIKSGARPVKQSQRMIRPELVLQIEVEVNKLIGAGFIREVKYPSWISNIVPIKKKNGQIRVCVDFQDLNKACPKDDFPLPIIELMVDATTGHEAMSFMDGSSGYNQIRMSPKDKECTAFQTPKGIYCYKVMP
ncbi:uncharacterized protein LOC142162052 [Nicotiana tabacum]|uniref:Uncharacterized protein LOC142162052 n=1 Tax=Nicotiana tabacum TaxID=4097 RepID=A0AC58RP40_TOBAC